MLQKDNLSMMFIRNERQGVGLERLGADVRAENFVRVYIRGKEDPR